MRRVRLAVPAVASAGLLTACTVGGPPTTVTSPGGYIVVVSTWTGDAFPDAAIEGRLVWSGGCLAVEGVEDTHLLVMPEGTTAPSDDTLALRDGGTVAIGSDVQWGGGYSTLDDDPGAPFDSLPEACLTDEVAGVNPIDSSAG